MPRSRSSISNARSHKDIGEFWDTHDLTDYWDQTTPAEFKVDIQSEANRTQTVREVFPHSEKTRCACRDSVESLAKRKARPGIRGKIDGPTRNCAASAYARIATTSF